MTLPPGVPASEIRRFLLRQQDWLAAACSRQPVQIQVEEGCLIPVDGRPVAIVAEIGPRRPPVLEGDQLIVSGEGSLAPRVQAWLKDHAWMSMVPAVHEFAESLGKPVDSVRLKDTRSRWGSCSSAGRINLSWRLAMAPREVQEYVAAHEAAHLVEMNHSDRYWSLLDRLMPGYQKNRDWLRKEGKSLHRYQFEDPRPHRARTHATSAATSSGSNPRR